MGTVQIPSGYWIGTYSSGCIETKKLLSLQGLRNDYFDETVISKVDQIYKGGEILFCFSKSCSSKITCVFPACGSLMSSKTVTSLIATEGVSSKSSLQLLRQTLT